MAEEAGDSMDQGGTLDAQGVDAGGDDARGKTDTRTYTQAEVDDIVARRLTRDRRDEGRVRVSEQELNRLRDKAQKFDELEQANQTEIEKAMGRATELEQQLTRERQERRMADLRSSILAEAAKSGRRVADPEATVTFLTGPDMDLLEVDDDGAPNDIAKAMDQLLERRSYLVATDGGRRGDADQGARGGGTHQVSREQLQNMSNAEIVKAQREGRLSQVLGASQ